MAAEDCTGSITSTSLKILLVFDFDNTIVKENTYIKIMDVLPDFDTTPYKHVYEEQGWTGYMGKICEVFRANGMYKEDFEIVLKQLELTTGMKQLFNFIAEHERTIECIIVSDSNSWFIEFLVKYHKLTGMFRDTFTNPATWEYDTLRIKPYTDKHDCPKCPVNMCKTEIVNYERMGYGQVVYIGDGYNDVCPVLTLRGGDLACPRIGYEMARIIKLKENELEADLQFWKSATEIIPALENMLENM